MGQGDVRPLVAGTILMVALVIGGSSRQALWSTFAVQAALFAVVPWLVDWSKPSNYRQAVRYLVVAALSVIAVQLLPLGWLLPNGAIARLSIELPKQLALTVDWSRTAEAMLFVLPPALLFLALGRFDANAVNRLLPFFYLGTLFNIVFALVQFASRAKIDAEFLPYQTAAGFFANQNHFATLMFVATPMVIYQFAAIRRPFLSLAAVAVILVASFATRSVAGVFLSLGCAFVSYALIVRMPRLWRLILIGLTVVGAVVLSFNPGNVLEFTADNPLDRTAIWRTTVSAIFGYLPLGAGFGTFDLVYPQFEAAADIRSSFINHAHNEYLELLLEGGLPSAAVIVAYFLLLALAMWRLPPSPLRWAGFCGLLFMLIHSLVDYPLRNISLLLVFVLLNALVFSRQLTRSASNKAFG